MLPSDEAGDEADDEGRAWEEAYPASSSRSPLVLNPGIFAPFRASPALGRRPDRSTFADAQSTITIINFNSDEHAASPQSPPLQQPDHTHSPLIAEPHLQYLQYLDR